jgi:hypothetical protein
MAGYTRWNDSARTVTTHGDTGAQLSSRPYTAAENSAADARIAQATSNANRATIEQALADALTTLQSVIDDTNANINANPAARIKDLARVQRRAIRLLIRRFDGTA